MNILLVDSDSKHRAKLSSRFRLQNIEVEIATGGFHALHILEQEENPTKIYTTILVMEDTNDMGGGEIAEHIQSLCKNPPPIICIHKKDLPIKSKKNIKESGVDEIFFLTEQNFNQLVKSIERLKK